MMALMTQKPMLYSTRKTLFPVLKALGAEHIPIVEHHEDGEEQTELIGCHAVSTTVEVEFEQVGHAVDVVEVENVDHSEADEKQGTAHAEDVVSHSWLMMNAPWLRGFSFITSADGGSEARAMAAKVSMMRFTHSICVTVRGDCLPRKAPANTIKQAATLTVSWKRMKRWMFS